MKNKKTKKPDLLTSYLLLFKLEGHETWRTTITDEKGKFEKTFAQDLPPEKRPKITNTRYFVIDRVKGTISE